MTRGWVAVLLALSAVLSDYRPTLEHWPHLVDEILLTDFRLLAEGADPACK